MKKFVLTGGVGVGKSTTIHELARQGYKTIFEIPKVLIEQYQQEHGKGRFPWENGQRAEFQGRIIDKWVIEESRVKADLIFMDRCLIDTIPFYLIDDLQPPARLIELCEILEYDKIFFLDALPKDMYRNASYRPQSYELSKRLGRMTLAAYEEFGYDPIIVPYMTVKERAEFILKESRVSHFEEKMENGVKGVGALVGQIE